MNKNTIFTLLTLIMLLFISAPIANAEINNNVKEPYKPVKPYSERNYTVTTTDNHLINAYLSYPKLKKKGFPTVILLHSIGRNSKPFVSLQRDLNNEGYAVLRLDFRGHGKSVYDKNLRQRSWITYKNSEFEKYPQDVLEVIEKIKKETKKANFDNYAILGSDIGANTAVLVAKALPEKPKALVLISPQMTFKGLYIPVAMTEIGKTPILAISSKTNIRFMQEQEKLSRFAQGTFDVYNIEKGGADMFVFKQYPDMQPMVIDWIKQYLK
ncbi:alpha/beta fold hydrolase [bacterium]|nr:alpha/beta fold hydrolase [bacterium]